MFIEERQNGEPVARRFYASEQDWYSCEFLLLSSRKMCLLLKIGML